ncbi:MAG TPA: hypothetical protein VKT49_23335 [Bryobacteraceae bacterium]|nr:hypothetical protein [Bryobacteraceae bacterium]
MFIARSRQFTTLVLAVIFPVMSAIAEESHVVPLSELHREAAAATQSRQANLAELEHFFSSDSAQQALRTVKIDGDQVKSALPLLGDEELARLAVRAGQAQADFAAGALTNQQITYILIALATAVIILVIVAR